MGVGGGVMLLGCGDGFVLGVLGAGEQLSPAALVACACLSLASRLVTARRSPSSASAFDLVAAAAAPVGYRAALSLADGASMGRGKGWAEAFR